jgi:NTP pyrophosphatase (non-canonical NTP hydrolase)
MIRADIWQAILAERKRQYAKWDAPHEWGQGDCSSLALAPEVKAVVLSEECGEVSRAVLERDLDALRTELVQVAAVAVAWLESL